MRPKRTFGARFQAEAAQGGPRLWIGRRQGHDDEAHDDKDAHAIERAEAPGLVEERGHSHVVDAAGDKNVQAAGNEPSTSPLIAIATKRRPKLLA
jgi:hypothetical protein